jgi:nicotinamidase-related amidase
MVSQTKVGGIADPTRAPGVTGGTADVAGWDRFLTEQDRKVLEIWGKTKLNGFGKRPALLIVDALYYAVGDRREPIEESIKRWPMSCGLEGWEAIDRTVPVLDAARRYGIPVIHARDLHGFPSPWQRWRAREKSRFSLDHLPEDVRSKYNEIVDELAPIEGEPVIDRPSPSVFAGSPLLYHLTYNEIDTVIVCGESTSGCVRATVVDAATNRFYVGVIGDCTFDRTQASHWMNLFDMHSKYADVVDSPDIVEYFASVGSERGVLATA